jgi:hypothetical protein
MTGEDRIVKTFARDFMRGHKIEKNGDDHLRPL